MKRSLKPTHLKPTKMDPVLSIALASIGSFLVGRFLQGGARWRETQAFGLSIAREIFFLVRKLEDYERVLKKFEKDLESVTGDTVPLIPLTDSDMLVFSGNTGKIGFLDPRLSFVVLKFYQRTRDLISDSKHNWDGKEAEWIDKDQNIVSPNWSLFLRDHIDRVSEMNFYVKPRMELINTWASQPYLKKLLSDLRNTIRIKKVETEI